MLKKWLPRILMAPVALVCFPVIWVATVIVTQSTELANEDFRVLFKTYWDGDKLC